MCGILGHLDVLQKHGPCEGYVKNVLLVNLRNLEVVQKPWPLVSCAETRATWRLCGNLGHTEAV